MIVTFSGTDGAGKSTQIERLSAHLKNKNTTVVKIWARGGYTPFFDFLKRIARKFLQQRLPKPGRSLSRTKSFNNQVVSRIWLWIAILDLIIFWGVYVRILSIFGICVICDRYLEDTRLDFRLNFPKSNFEKFVLWRLLELIAPNPDASFLLWVPVNVSLVRSAQKNEPFPDDEETLFWRLDSYLDEKKFSSKKYMKLDGTTPIDDMSQLIIQECKNRGVI